MRLLSNTEIPQVSGAMTVTINECYSTEYLIGLHEDASREATIFALGAGVLSSLLFTTIAQQLGVSSLTSYMTGAITGLAASAYTYIASYNSFELWPWNN